MTARIAYQLATALAVCAGVWGVGAFIAWDVSWMDAKGFRIMAACVAIYAACFVK